MMMLLSMAAQATGGRISGPDTEFNAVSTDSRSIKAGDLFIALRGEHFDGHDYATDCLARGAAAVMVDQQSAVSHQPSATSPQSSVLVVADTRLALGALAAYWRSRFELPLAAITGSNGKTTVKEMLASILRMASGDDAAH